MFVTQGRDLDTWSWWAPVHNRPSVINFIWSQLENDGFHLSRRKLGCTIVKRHISQPKTQFTESQGVLFLFMYLSIASSASKIHSTLASNRLVISWALMPPSITALPMTMMLFVFLEIIIMQSNSFQQFFLPSEFAGLL